LERLKQTFVMMLQEMEKLTRLMHGKYLKRRLKNKIKIKIKKQKWKK